MYRAHDKCWAHFEEKKTKSRRWTVPENNRRLYVKRRGVMKTDSNRTTRHSYASQWIYSLTARFCLDLLILELKFIRFVFKSLYVGSWDVHTKREKLRQARDALDAYTSSLKAKYQNSKVVASAPPCTLVPAVRVGPIWL
jgi:hypothetical protein